MAHEFAARPLTRGPRHHFFGYYGICPWNAAGTHLLCLESTFHDRPPTAADTAAIGLVEQATGVFEPLAETRAWNLQQGCMLHWLPTDPDRLIVYNDRQGDRFVAVVLDVHSGRKHVLPRPVSGLSHAGRWALSLNYARLNSLRPVVGYAGLPDLYADQPHPVDDGLYLMDMESGEARVLVSCQQVWEFLGCPPEMNEHNMWFNHTVFNRDDSRVCFVSRWNRRPGTIEQTHLLTASVDGGDLRLLLERGASHFDWRTPTEILVWSDPALGPHYCLIDEQTGARRTIGRGILTRDGHCSFSRDGRWVLSDTGPDEDEMQMLYLWDMDEERQVVLGRFHSPRPFRGEIRCDLHPRWSRDENTVCFDSVHEGTRQVYGVDVSWR